MNQRRWVPGVHGSVREELIGDRWVKCNGVAFDQVHPDDLTAALNRDLERHFRLENSSAEATP